MKHLKSIKMDRAQYSGSFYIPKLKLNELNNKKGGSQLDNAQLDDSASKLTHRLNDLNVRYA